MRTKSLGQGRAYWIAVCGALVFCAVVWIGAYKSRHGGYGYDIQGHQDEVPQHPCAAVYDAPGGDLDLCWGNVVHGEAGDTYNNDTPNDTVCTQISGNWICRPATIDSPLEPLTDHETHVPVASPPTGPQ